jgi:integrase
MEVPEDIAWVFPGRDPAQPLSDIKRAWKLVRDQAGLEDFHLHDLRHTFASRVVSDTGSLYVAGQLLGHTQAQTTARYAHLLDDAMRDALDQVSDKLTAGHR